MCTPSRIRHALAGVLHLMLVSGLLAQTPPVGSGSDRQVADALLSDLPSVFGASRFDQLSSEAPASVTVLTRDEIRAHGWRTIAEMLQSVRGFYTTYDGLYQTMGARGFGRPGDYNSRLLIVVDGHRVNENVFDGGMVGFESVVGIDEIERVEVIRGPASSLYGTSAFFGVINVVTSSGRSLGGVRASVAQESFGATTVGFSAGDRSARGLDWRLTASRRRSAGRDFFFSEFDTSATAGWARGLDGERRDRVALRMSAGSVVLSGALNLRRKDVATARYGVDYAASGNAFEDNQGYIGLSWDRSLPKASTLRLTGSFNTYDYNGQYVYGGAPGSDWARGRWGVAEAQMTTAAFRDHKLVAGMQIVQNFRQDQGYSEDGVVTFADARSEGMQALYVQDEYRFPRGWLVNGGLRLDRYDTQGAVLNPRIGIIKTFGTGSAAKLLYGSAFRAPNVFERFYTGLDVAANPSLAPERLRTLELLLERRLSGHWKVTAAAFQNDVRDLIDHASIGDGIMVQYQNTGRVRARGMELELEFEWHGARGHATQIWQQATDRRLGGTLTNAPKYLTTVDVTLPLVRGATFTTETRVLGSRLAASGSMVGAYTVADAWLVVPMPGRHLSLSGGFYNVLGARYADPTGDDFIQPAIPQAGRTFRVALEAATR